MKTFTLKNWKGWFCEQFEEYLPSASPSSWRPGCWRVSHFDRRSPLKIRWTLVQLSHSVTQICHKQIWLTFRNDLFELEGGSNGAHGPHVQPNTPAAGWCFCSFSKPLTKKKTLGPFVKILTDGKICLRQRFSDFCHTGVWRLGWDFVRHHRDWWVVPRVHYRCATYMYNHALRTLIYI